MRAVQRTLIFSSLLFFLALLPATSRANWKKREARHANTVEADRKNRLSINEQLLKKAKNPANQKVYRAKIETHKRALQLVGAFRAAIKAGDKTKTMLHKEALHLLRLKAESMTVQIEINLSIAAYKIFGGKLKGTVLPALQGMLKESEAYSAKFDGAIKALGI